MSKLAIPAEGEIYRHFNGSLYEILGVTTTGSPESEGFDPSSVVLGAYTCTHTELGSTHFVVNIGNLHWVVPELDHQCVAYMKAGCSLSDEPRHIRPLDNFLGIVDSTGNPKRFEKVLK